MQTTTGEAESDDFLVTREEDAGGPMAKDANPWPKVPEKGRQDMQVEGILLRYATNLLLVLFAGLVTAAVSQWVLKLVLGGFLSERDFWVKSIPFALGVTMSAVSLMVIIAKRMISVNAASGVVTKSYFSNHMWSYLQGLYLLFPWEDVFKVLDLTRETKMGESQDEAYITLNDAKVKPRFFLPKRIHPYFMVNYAKSDEGAAEPMFKARIKRFLTLLIRQKTDKKIIELLPRIKKEFVNVFGGPDKTDTLEEMFGVWTGNPELFAIERVGASEESRAKIIEVETMDEAIMSHLERMREFDENYTLDEAKRFVMLATNEIQQTIHTIDGLGSFKDLPRDLHDVNLVINAGGAMGLGQQGQGKGNKGKYVQKGQQQKGKGK